MICIKKNCIYIIYTSAKMEYLDLIRALCGVFKEDVYSAHLIISILN